MSEHYYDARGLICPLPVLKARKILLSLPAGSSLRISVTDKHAAQDFALFCEEQGYTLSAVEEKGEAQDIIVLKTA